MGIFVRGPVQSYGFEEFIGANQCTAPTTTK